MSENKISKNKINVSSPRITLDAILEAAVDGIIIIDSRGVIDLVNPAVEKLFGYKSSELVGQNIAILMPEPDKSNHDRYISSFITTGEKKIIGTGREVMGKRKDGVLFPFKLSVSEILVDNERHFTGVIHDISEQKKVQQELEDLNEQLEKRVEERTKQVQEALDKERQLNEMKSRFVSMASHEFRTPLGTILSSVSLVERYNTPDTEERREKHIKRIKSSVKNLTNILDDFLSLDKLETGRLKVNNVDLDIKELTESVIDDIATIAKHGQTISLDYKGGSVIQIDHNIYKNVLINLLSNAIKYSEENDPIEVKCTLDDVQLTLEVQDHGIGIPEEEQEMMFERFFRAKNATNIQGTGLGLNIVKKYIELMNGTIFFESTQGQGTKFIVKIPV